MTLISVNKALNILSLEDWMQNPPQGKEWVDGKLVDKHPLVWIDNQGSEQNGTTLEHSRIQANLSFYWRSYRNSSGQGGEVYTDVPCRNTKQGRSPDVAYLTPALADQYGTANVLPQSFPLSAEIVLPTDFAEDVIAKAYEYLQSSGEEVWLIFPANRWVIVLTQTTRQIFVSGEIVTTQTTLSGFSVAVDDLLA